MTRRAINPAQVARDGAMFLLQARCGCTWTVTAREYEGMSNDDRFVCEHRENRLEELLAREIPVRRL